MRIRYAGTFSTSVVVGWMLMMPPVPLGTELPPMSEWSPLSAFKTSEQCTRAADGMHERARVTIAGDPNASALEVAAAMGRLQARCVESKTPEPVRAPEPAPAP
jgi:hypothetical protein